MRDLYLSYLLKKSMEGDPLVGVKKGLQYGGLILSRATRKSLAGPLHGAIVVTYKCNLHCPMCFLWKGPGEYDKQHDKKELSTEEMFSLIDDFAAIGTAGIGFTGGEPILRPDMLEIIAYTKKKGIVTHMSSNGYVIANKNIAKKVVESGLDAIGFSVDGALPETHDAIRGKGSHERVLQAIDNIIELRKELKSSIKVVVVCVVSNYNVDQLINLITILKEKKVDHVSFMPFHDIGLLSSGTENSQEFKIMQEKIAKLNKAVDELINIKKKSKAIENSLAYLKLFKDAFSGKKLPVSCYAGYATVCIGAYGDIYPCFPRMEGEIEKGSNIRKTPLKEYWYSSQIKEDREKIRACRECFWNNQTEINLLFHPFYKK
ncbi:radical SAM protein [Candidatus Woesearchaeota archaeon]|nr:radical SAM protein [Candidatus Woesearchaeota archaeon]